MIMAEQSCIDIPQATIVYTDYLSEWPAVVTFLQLMRFSPLLIDTWRPSPIALQHHMLLGY